MANNQNLKPWKPGQSGNPSGKPKGAKHLSTWIREAMEDELFMYELNNGDKYTGAPVKVIVQTLIAKGIAGDYKAIDLLAKYGYGSKISFSDEQINLVIPILNGASKTEG